MPSKAKTRCIALILLLAPVAETTRAAAVQSLSGVRDVRLYVRQGYDDKAHLTNKLLEDYVKRYLSRLAPKLRFSSLERKSLETKHHPIVAIWVNVLDMKDDGIPAYHAGILLSVTQDVTLKRGRIKTYAATYLTSRNATVAYSDVNRSRNVITDTLLKIVVKDFADDWNSANQNPPKTSATLKNASQREIYGAARTKGLRRLNFEVDYPRGVRRFGVSEAKTKSYLGRLLADRDLPIKLSTSKDAATFVYMVTEVPVPSRSFWATANVYMLEQPATIQHLKYEIKAITRYEYSLVSMRNRDVKDFYRYPIEDFKGMLDRFEMAEELGK